MCINVEVTKKPSAQLVVKALLNAKLKLAQRMEGTHLLKVTYALEPIHIKTVQKLFTQFPKATYSYRGKFVLKFIHFLTRKIPRQWLNIMSGQYHEWSFCSRVSTCHL